MGSGRRVRTLVAAIVTVILAVAAHVAGSGEAPPLPVILPVVAAVWAAAYRLSERRVTRLQILALLGCAQVAVHLLGMVVVAGHGHGAGAEIDPVVMACAHAVATVGAAAVLGLGERVWWQLLSWLRRQIPAAYRPATVRVRSTWAPSAYIAVVGRRDCPGPVGTRAPPGLL